MFRVIKEFEGVLWGLLDGDATHVVWDLQMTTVERASVKDDVLHHR
jgi:hypothetical protein